MSKSTVTTCGAASAIALAAVAGTVTIGIAPAAAAVTVVYGGGATFPEKAYRDVFNCYGDSSGGELTANLTGGATTCNAATAYNGNVAVLYSGVGSGNGLNAFVHHDPSEYTHNSLTGATKAPDKPPVTGTTAYGEFYGNGTGTGWVPSASNTSYFPHVSMTGSDDPMTKKQLYGLGNFTYQDASWGHPIQFPTLIGAAALDYNPASGNATWTENGAVIAGNDNHLSLSTNTWCGIWTGAITNWNNAEITADNGNVSVTGGVNYPIAVRHRSDGSGTTWVFANALIHQCGTASNHIATGTKTQTHPVPDEWFSSPGNLSLQVSDNSFFIKAKTNYEAVHGAGSWATAYPNFAGANGNGGVKAAVIGTPGAVGYNTTDFINLSGGLPDPTGPRAANLQTWKSFGAKVKVFMAPTVTAITNIMKTAKAPKFTAGSCPVISAQPNVGESYDGICAHNPLNWGPAIPTPLNPQAYAIGGFTFMNIYSCYASQADADAIADKLKTKGHHLGLWRWWFDATSTQVKTGLNSNGFAEVPNSWKGSIKKLLTTDTFTRVQGIGGNISGGCNSNITVAGGA